eukprot:9226177-Pyramimonas_sp.AAC.1
MSSFDACHAPRHPPPCYPPRLPLPTYILLRRTRGYSRLQVILESRVPSALQGTVRGGNGGEMRAGRA